MIKQISLLILIALFSISLEAQNSVTVINETLNSDGCTTSFQLEFNITEHSSATHWYALHLVSFTTDPSSDVIQLPQINGNGTFISDVITLTHRTSILFRERRTVGRRRKLITHQILTLIHCPNDNDDDGVPNDEDSCPDLTDTGIDTDNDGIDNICDSQDNRDSDGDGLENWEDNCPNAAGPPSTNGCPGDPNLVLDLSVTNVFSHCTTCPPPIESLLLTNKKHLIANGGVGQLFFDKIQIRNVGNLSASSSKAKIYFSLDDSLDTNDDVLLHTGNIPNLNPGNSFGFEHLITGWDINDNGNLANGTYYLIIDVDSNNNVNEGSAGESDNLFVLELQYSNSNISTIRPFSTKTNGGNIIGKTDENPREVLIYNFSGVLEKKATISTEADQKEILKNLPKGIYIIKDKGNNKTIKVHN